MGTIDNFFEFNSEVDISINVPVLYGMLSILLALVLGVGAAILRRFFSNLRKNKQSVKTK